VSTSKSIGNWRQTATGLVSCVGLCVARAACSSERATPSLATSNSEGQTPAKDGAISSSTSTLWTPRYIDLRGRTLPVFRSGLPVVLIFLGTDCPVSNYYVPTLNTLAGRLPSPAPRTASEGPVLYGVISDPPNAERFGTHGGQIDP
jgi:hypothetical protein